MVNKLLKSLLVLAFILFSTGVFAQGGGQGPPPPGGSPPDDDITPPGYPVDGGIVVLLALGIGYGIKKIKDKE